MGEVAPKASEGARSCQLEIVFQWGNTYPLRFACAQHLPHKEWGRNSSFPTRELVSRNPDQPDFDHHQGEHADHEERQHHPQTRIPFGDETAPFTAEIAG